MATYYISAAGSDRNDGLSRETPWQTTYKLRERIRGGDTVLLRCGDTFYGTVPLPDGIDPGNRTVLSFYGAGEKPKICLYKKVTREDAWEEVAPCYWRTDLTDPSRYEGNIFTNDTNVGFLFVNGEIHGDRCFDRSLPGAAWQFYCDSQYVYVWSDKNPNLYAEEVCFAVENGIRLGNHCEIRGLDIFGGGCHAVSGSVTDAVIADCLIHDFGGAHLASYPRPNVRFGNGIEFWCGGKDILVENNRIFNIYDVGVTMQGYPLPGEGWDNVIYRNNVFWGNEQTFEIWTHNSEKGEGIRRCAFRNNLCLDAGRGWSHSVRPDKAVGVHLLIYGILCEKTDVTVENNVFADPYSALYFKSRFEQDGEIPSDYVTRNNRLFLRKGAFILNGKHVYRAEELDRFRSEYHREEGSVLTLLDGQSAPVEERIAEYSKYINA